MTWRGHLHRRRAEGAKCWFGHDQTTCHSNYQRSLRHHLHQIGAVVRRAVAIVQQSVGANRDAVDGPCRRIGLQRGLDRPEAPVAATRTSPAGVFSEASTLITTTTQQRRRNTAFVIQRQQKRRRTRSGCRQEISRYLQHGLWLNLDASVVKNFSAMFFTTPLTRRDPNCASFPPTAPRLHTLARCYPLRLGGGHEHRPWQSPRPPNLRPEFDSRY
jgi:hypothetical protein